MSLEPPSSSATMWSISSVRPYSLGVIPYSFSTANFSDCGTLRTPPVRNVREQMTALVMPHRDNRQPVEELSSCARWPRRGGRAARGSRAAPRARRLAARAIERGDSLSSLAEAEDELGVVGHPLGRPGRIPRQLGLDL